MTGKNAHLLSEIEENIHIQNMIFSVRGRQIMLDHDIAICFGVETKRLNEQVKRNNERFPDEFCFKLNEREKNELVAKCDHLKKLKYSPVLPNAFTEQGVAMLTTVLKSDTAISASIHIMKAFVGMRKFMLENSQILHRLGTLELKQIQTDNRVNTILKALESKDLNKKQGIFFDGQVFDAHLFASDLIKSAKESLILIDNYIDEQTLKLMSNKDDDVKITIYTHKPRPDKELAQKRFREQYPLTEIHIFERSHDRFFIIDKKEIYHIGASLKDLGKKWFAFTKLDISPDIILERLSV